MLVLAPPTRQVQQADGVGGNMRVRTLAVYSAGVSVWCPWRSSRLALASLSCHTYRTCRCSRPNAGVGAVGHGTRHPQKGRERGEGACVFFACAISRFCFRSVRVVVVVVAKVSVGCIW